MTIRFIIIGMVSLFLLGLSGSDHPFPQGNKLRLSTFNIAYYGLGAEAAGSLKDEYRDPWLKEFWPKELMESDVIAFQEIIDVPRIQKLMGGKHQCVSYDHASPKHQHAVLCYRSDYKFEKEAGDDNFLIDEVAMGRYRPALSGLLKNEGGGPLAHIIAVHLKAMPDSSDIRMAQTELIAKRMGSFKDGVPIVYLGDINTHETTLTKKIANDDIMMDTIFKNHGLSLVQVPNPSAYTFRTATYPNPPEGYKLDRFWVSKEILSGAGAKVLGPCNSAVYDGQRFGRISFYNRFISDHCPVTTILEWGDSLGW